MSQIKKMINLVFQYEVEWTEGDKQSKKNAFQAAKDGDFSSGGAGVDGFWHTKRISQGRVLKADPSHTRAALEEVVGALKRIVGACTRYLEEQAPSESEMYDPSYIGPLEQAHAALDRCSSVEKGEEDNNENQT